MEINKKTGGETIAYYISHPSRKLVFRGECGVCGRHLRRNSKNKTGYMCKSCGPATGIAQEGRGSVCTYCPFEMDCTRRVQLGIWVRCETPDIADLERLKTSGGLDNEEVRNAVDASLENRGIRKILEEAISESSKEIYKNVVDGKEGQRSIGIRVES